MFPPVGELPSFVEDLGGQLPSGSQNQSKRVLLVATAVVAGPRALDRCRPCLVDTVHDGNQEGGSLATSGLGAGHQIALAQNHRN